MVEELQHRHAGTQEGPAFALPGVVGVALMLLLGLLALLLFGLLHPVAFVTAVIVGVLAVICVGGFIVLQPNEAGVIVILGQIGRAHV